MNVGSTILRCRVLRALRASEIVAGARTDGRLDRVSSTVGHALSQPSVGLAPPLSPLLATLNPLSRQLCTSCRLHSGTAPAVATRVPVAETSDVNQNAFSAKSSFTRPSPGMGPRALYQQRVTSGELHRDDKQLGVVGHLDELHGKMLSYSPPAPVSDAMGVFFKSMGLKKERTVSSAFHDPSIPRGVYIWGSVGCGKTMLMDLFYATCGKVRKKQRVHFHSFMLNVHKKVHTLKQEMAPRQYNMARTEAFDPIPPVAASIASRYSLICFDEFQVTDIADAMILKRLFAELWKHGVVVVATSNRHPRDLYKNGLQRGNFLPFIDLLATHSRVVHLDSTVDYRVQSGLSVENTYFLTSRADANSSMDRAFRDLAATQYDTVVKATTVSVMSRTLVFPKTCGTLLDTSFDELCRKPLGAVDYLAISKEFDVVFIRDIPYMTLRDKSAARRFITLIDTLYDNQIRVVCSAADHPENLFSSQSDDSLQEANAMRMLQDDLKISDSSQDKAYSVFTGEEELFAWDRTVSRLSEMQTAQYWMEHDEALHEDDDDDEE